MGQNSSKSVLVVDDSVDMRDLLTLLLESNGYSVKCRSNGVEALEWLDSEAPLPSVILLDLRMPVLDGMGFLESQKKSTRLSSIPVIMMTADDDLSEVKSKFDIHQVLTKPLNMKSVLTALSATNSLH